MTIAKSSPIRNYARNLKYILDWFITTLGEINTEAYILFLMAKKGRKLNRNFERKAAALNNVALIYFGARKKYEEAKIKI